MSSKKEKGKEKLEDNQRPSKTDRSIKRRRIGDDGEPSKSKSADLSPSRLSDLRRRRINDDGGGAGPSKRRRIEDDGEPSKTHPPIYIPRPRRDAKTATLCQVQRPCQSLRIAIDRLCPRDLWKVKTLVFDYKGKGSDDRGKIRLSYFSLNQSVKQWMREVGQSISWRLAEGFGLKLPGSDEEPSNLADQIKIVDGQVRLPDPSSHENNDDGFLLVRLYKTLLDQQVLLSEVATPDFQSLKKCLEHILRSRSPKSLFKTITCHYWYDSAYIKLTLLEHSLRILTNANVLNTYLEWITLDSSDIYSCIGENPVLLSVYHFLSNPGSVSTYEDNAAGVLLFCVNFIKHCDQHCLKLQIGCWTVEEKVALLEHCFPHLFHNLFFFLWSRGINVDLHGILRQSDDDKR